MKELSYHAEFFCGWSVQPKTQYKKNQPTCLDDFNKNLHTLLHLWKGMTKKKILVLGCQHILILALDFFITVAPIWCPYLARCFKKISEKGFDSFLDQSISFIIPRYMRGWWLLFKLRNFLDKGFTALRMTLCAAGERPSVLTRVTSINAAATHKIAENIRTKKLKSL